MYQLKMMNGDVFNISKEEVQLVAGKGGLVMIPSLNGLVNISSISSILPVEIANKEFQYRKQNRDDQWCVDIFKNNDWRLESNKEVKIDTSYYPEILNAYEKKQTYLGIDSPFAKELKDKF